MKTNQDFYLSPASSPQGSGMGRNFVKSDSKVVNCSTYQRVLFYLDLKVTSILLVLKFCALCIAECLC